jgi:PD-(D/E)XK nuclease superfamily
MWSFSNGRLFNKCQRAWFYKNHVANANATKNPVQREAYILSTLQSVWSWRGRIVDHVISQRIVPALERGWTINVNALLEYTRSVFDRQREFALLNRVREPGMSQTKGGESFAALYAVEYGTGVTAEEMKRAWADVEQALLNLLDMRDLLTDLRRAERLIAQRPLTFEVFQAKAKAVPDLIAFFRDEPPLIVDWKVHTFGNRDYRLQLAAYAVALVRSPPHQDFPAGLSLYEPEDVRLLEAQLLTKASRPYKLTERDVDAMESRIVESFMEMSLAAGAAGVRGLGAFDYPAAEYPEACEKCPFRKVCWEEQLCQESKQMTLL